MDRTKAFAYWFASDFRFTYLDAVVLIAGTFKGGWSGFALIVLGLYLSYVIGRAVHYWSRST